MKKARIVLMLIFLLGIAGGISAFKAKSAFGGTTYYYTTVKGGIASRTFLSGSTTSPAFGIWVYITFVFLHPATFYAHLTIAATE